MLLTITQNIHMPDVADDSLVNKSLPSDAWTTSSSCFSWLQTRCTNYVLALKMTQPAIIQSVQDKTNIISDPQPCLS